ncbi:MAG: 6-carboxytetrahydropterin synthase [Pyrobaculum sp.]
MRTCVELRGSISVAHNPSFSPQWAKIHGHDYVITVGICRDGDADIVVDADTATKKLQQILASMDGKYLASSSEDVKKLGNIDVYVVPCSLPGLSGECLARHLANLMDADWVRVCESAFGAPCFYYESK